MRMMILALMFALAVGCGVDSQGVAPRPSVSTPPQVAEVGPAPTATPAAVEMLVTTPRFEIEGLKTLEERMAFFDVVARVRLVGVEGHVEGALRYSALKFNFRVLEYLAGSGPTDIFAIGIHRGHLDDAAAWAELPKLLAERDTRWDDREAIVFLLSEGPADFPSTRQTDHFFLYSLSVYTENGWEDNYTVASRGTRKWLPEASSAGTGARSSEKMYLLESPGSGTDARSGSSSASAASITLSDFKRRLAAIQAEIDAGDGTSAYRDCVHGKYRTARIIRYRLQNTPDLWRHDVEMESGLPSGSTVHAKGADDGIPGDVGRHTLSGPDSELFGISTTQGAPGSVSVHGKLRTWLVYTWIVSTERPLPAGDYEFYYTRLAGMSTLCNGLADEERDLFRFYVTATAPAGVLHEAFFDPVTAGTALKADGTNGVLKPSSFTDANNASATLQSISYEPPSSGSGSGTVKLQVDPHTGLGGHRLDFIELDGTVSLSLEVDAATVDAANNTLSWPVASQPWSDGDKLMLRVAEVVPGIALLNVPSTIAHGQIETFTVRASGLTPSGSYSVLLTTDNGHLGFHSTCSITEHMRAVSGSSSSSFDMNIQGCTVGSVTLTASLLEGTATLGTSGFVVEVESSRRVRLSLSPREGRLGPHTDMSIEWTDPDGCDGRYFVGLLTSREVVYRSYGFHPAPATTTLELETGLSWDWVQTFDGFIRVSCHPAASSNTWVLGQATLQSGLPSPPSSQ